MPSRMRPVFVVFHQPVIKINLQFLQGAVKFLAEGDVIELILDGFVEPFAVPLVCGERALVLVWSISSTPPSSTALL